MALPFFSSTRTIPDITAVPRHIAIIMDGNGRWAKQRFMPRVMGHQRGVETVREMVKACRKLGVEYLTLFAFSSENWRRPPDEVSFLMQLFLKMLEREVGKLHKNNICLKVIGDRSRLDAQLVRYIEEAEQLTANNTSLT
ncbi:MAG: polyprenyl diphosphate synthase, partial [Gallionella sp.]